jgi:hypothetical protein
MNWESSFARDKGIHFDLDQPIGIDETADLEDRGYRANLSEELAVHRADCLPVSYAGKQQAGADHILQAGAELLQGGDDDLKATAGLDTRVADANGFAVRAKRGSAGDDNQVPEAYGTRHANDRFVRTASENALSIGHQEAPYLVDVILSKWEKAGQPGLPWKGVRRRAR